MEHIDPRFRKNALTLAGAIRTAVADMGPAATTTALDLAEYVEDIVQGRKRHGMPQIAADIALHLGHNAPHGIRLLTAIEHLRNGNALDACVTLDNAAYLLGVKLP